MSITEDLRKVFDACTVMAGVEPDFECVYMTKGVALLYLDEIDAENAKLRNEVDNLMDFEHLTSVAVAYAGCDECGEYKQTMLRLFAENAKLRELVIRCKDCRYYDGIIHSCMRMDTMTGKQVSYVFDDDFCCWGKRKDDQ